MKSYEPDTSTVEQLEQLGYSKKAETPAKHSRPLLICDVDEVVLHLVNPFASLLQERGYILKDHSFRLTGNIFHDGTGKEATQQEVWDLLDQLFCEQERRQHIVDGVVESLLNLAKNVDIVFLTNMPHIYRETRRTHLASHGLEFPLITNTRSKVPPVQILKQHCHAPVGFIDDTPKNLTQVSESVSDVVLFHFMANERFRQLAGRVEGVQHSFEDWQEAGEVIHVTLMENTEGT